MKNKNRHRWINYLPFLASLTLSLYFLILATSIDPVAYAYAYLDLAPILIAIYGIFLGFLSSSLVLTQRKEKIFFRWITWVVAVVLIWAMINTLLSFSKLKAALNLDVKDIFEITTHTGEINTTLWIALFSFLFYITSYTVGDLDWIEEALLPKAVTVSG